MKETATQKKNRILDSCSNMIYMYDFRGNLKDKFRDLNEAAEKLNKTISSISKYIKKENKFDGIHFLCRGKV